jgi:hypothetical protein
MDIGTADPAGADLDQDVLRTADRIGHVHIGHLLIFGKEQGFHRGEEGGFWREGKRVKRQERTERRVDQLNGWPVGRRGELAGRLTS